MIVTEESGKIKAVINEQLDRELYVKVNKALEALGGKWNRATKGHLFDTDPRLKLDDLLDTGSVTVEKDGFFETPLHVVLQMLSLVKPNGNILEPSAGLGAIVDNIRVSKDRITCVEKNEYRAKVLSDKGYCVYCCNFLDFQSSITKFDTIYMNPPFEAEQDILHILHAFGLLNTWGHMISVMSEHAFFVLTKRASAFRDWLEAAGGYSESLPEGCFKEYGTGVKARLVIIRK
jgi:hypothetical protein